MNRLLIIFKRSALLVALLGVVTVFVGCGTVHGVGQDIERVGERLQDDLD